MRGEEFQALVRGLAWRWGLLVEAAVVASRDGLPRARAGGAELCELLAAHSASALAAVDALEVLTLSRVKRVRVELESGLEVLITPLNGVFLSLLARGEAGKLHVVSRLLEDQLGRASGVVG